MNFRAEVVTEDGQHVLVVTDSATGQTRRYPLTTLAIGILAPSATLALARDLRKAKG